MPDPVPNQADRPSWNTVLRTPVESAPHLGAPVPAQPRRAAAARSVLQPGRTRALYRLTQSRSVRLPTPAARSPHGSVCLRPPARPPAGGGAPPGSRISSPMPQAHPPCGRCSWSRCQPAWVPPVISMSNHRIQGANTDRIPHNVPLLFMSTLFRGLVLDGHVFRTSLPLSVT